MPRALFFPFFLFACTGPSLSCPEGHSLVEGRCIADSAPDQPMAPSSIDGSMPAAPEPASDAGAQTTVVRQGELSCTQTCYGNRCNLDLGRCVSCLEDSDCDDELVCHAGRGECVECTSDEQCDNGCDEITGRCLECDSNADCPPSDPICRVGHCTQCGSSDACGAGQACQPYTGECGEALPPADNCVPRVEYCNGRDDDCDGQIDEGVSYERFLDRDGDGYGTESLGRFCARYSETGRRPGDCGDEDPRAYPSTEHFWPTPIEGTNSYDFDCNGREETQWVAVDSIDEAIQFCGSCPTGTGYRHQYIGEPTCGHRIQAFICRQAPTTRCYPEVWDNEPVRCH